MTSPSPTSDPAASPAGVRLPVEYRDGSATTVLYPVDALAAERLLQPAGLVAAHTRDGKAICAVSWFEYRDTSIGPYNELAIALIAGPGPRLPRFPRLRMLAGDVRVGAYVLHLPVTSQLACSGGKQLFGYPKQVAEISLRRTASLLDAQLSENGRRIFAMQIPLGRAARLPMMDLVTFSSRGDDLLRTIIATECPMRIQRARGVELLVHAPTHRIGRNLQAFGLSTSTPTRVVHTERLRALRSEAVRVGTVRTRPVAAA